MTDQGQTYQGAEGIRHFLSEAGAQFTYTTELLAAQRVGDPDWVLTQRLRGDFPGAVADLDYLFTLRDDAITRLVIGS